MKEGKGKPSQSAFLTLLKLDLRSPEERIILTGLAKFQLFAIRDFFSEAQSSVQKSLFGDCFAEIQKENPKETYFTLDFPNGSFNSSYI